MFVLLFFFYTPNDIIYFKNNNDVKKISPNKNNYFIIIIIIRKLYFQLIEKINNTLDKKTVKIKKPRKTKDIVDLIKPNLKTQEVY